MCLSFGQRRRSYSYQRRLKESAQTPEKILYVYIRDKLPLANFSEPQQAGRSIETVLNSLTQSIERALEQKKYALGLFVDINRALNNISNNAIVKSLEAARIERAFTASIKTLLSGRKINAEWNEARLCQITLASTQFIDLQVLCNATWRFRINTR